MANPDPLQVAQLWHEVLMYSSTPEEVARYPELMGRSPLEMRLLLMAGAAPHLLLRDYLAALHVPKSTLTKMCIRDSHHSLQAGGPPLPGGPLP